MFARRILPVLGNSEYFGKLFSFVYAHGEVEEFIGQDTQTDLVYGHEDYYKEGIFPVIVQNNNREQRSAFLVIWTTSDSRILGLVVSADDLPYAIEKYKGKAIYV